MGLCGSSLSEEEKVAVAETQKADQFLKKSGNEDKKIVKLLLLGTGESGKSTIFKQMQVIYESANFTDYEKTTFKHVVRRNVVESMQTLLYGCQKFGLEFENEKSEKSAKFIEGLDPLAADFWVDEIVAHCKHLWTSEPAIKKAYDMRSQLQLLDSAEYFFKRLDAIGQSNYSPDKEDILRARLRTSGIVEKTFHIKGSEFKFLDVGGQRNERRKWIHCFEDVTAVIFVAAISEFDQTLYEDEKVNRLDEALNVFKNIVTNKYFEQSTFLLFLNKIDLFQDKLQVRGIKLKDFHPKYDGDNSPVDAAGWIQKQFEDLNAKSGRLFFAHQTCATDTQNVERVFDTCRMAILNKNLKGIGIMGDSENMM